MGALTAYSITAAIILAIEYIVYKSLLANTTFHRFNRAVLLACYAIALIAVPLCHLFTGAGIESGNAATGGNITIEAPTATVPDQSPSGIGSALWKAIPLIYIMGVIGMTLMTVVSYIRMFRVICTGEHRYRDGVTIVVTETRVSPFSWGKYIVVSPEDADNEIIIAHEIVHVHNGDTLDLIVAQLFIIFNWFNPAAYLMRREISAVHEYEVDSKILESGIKASDYQMLLIKKTAGLRFQSIANSLNHSQLKNRLTMMMKSKSKRKRSLYAAALLPAALLVVSMTNLPAIASTIRNVAAVSYDKVSENNASAQELSVEASAAQSTADDNTIHKSVQTMPQYEGGISQMMQDLAKEIKYPEKAIKEGISGKVVVRFVVNTDGSMSDFEIVRAQNEDLDAEAIRAIKTALDGKWTPGIVEGKYVRVTYTLPVNFSLNSDNSDKK